MAVVSSTPVQSCPSPDLVMDLDCAPTLVPEHLKRHPAVLMIRHAMRIQLCKATILHLLAQRHADAALECLRLSINKRKEAATHRTIARASKNSEDSDVKALHAHIAVLELEALDSNREAVQENTLAASARSTYTLWTLVIKSKVRRCSQVFKVMMFPCKRSRH